MSVKRESAFLVCREQVVVEVSNLSPLIFAQAEDPAEFQTTQQVFLGETLIEIVTTVTGLQQKNVGETKISKYKKNMFRVRGRGETT